MADNYTFADNSAAELTAAADDISGVHFPRVKVTFGADGSSTDVSAAAPLPVDLGSNNDVVATNGGTFAVQEDGDALTALQLIDDAIHVDDAAATLGTSKGMAIMAFAGTQSVDANDMGFPSMSTGGSLYTVLKDSTGNIIDPATVTVDDPFNDTTGKLFMAGAVYRAAKELNVDTDGDAVPPAVNASGDLRVDAGTVKYKDLTLTLNTSAYADGDVLAVGEILTAVPRFNDDGALLHSLCVVDISDQAQPFDLIFMRTNTALGTINEAVSISAANLAAGIMGHVEVLAADYVDMINAQFVTKTNIGLALDMVSGSDDIYIGAVSRGTGTYAADGIQLRLGFVVQ